MGSIREELEQIQSLENEINELVEKRQYYYELAMKITPAYKTTEGSGDNIDCSKLDSYITKAADILSDIERKLKELDDIRQRYECLLEKIDDVNLRRLLWMRYFLYRRWEDIGREIYPNYSIEHVRGYLHGLALKKIKNQKS